MSTKQDLERQRILEALRPFREDFLHYAPRALKIKAKDGRLVPFVLNHAQIHTHSIVEEQQRLSGSVHVNLLKGRQQGLSTYVEGRAYWKTTLNPGLRALVLTHLGDSTDALFEMTKRFHENCHPLLQPHTGQSNEKELLFDQLDSGFVVGTAGSRKGLGRGRTFQILHCSEYAFWDNAKEHMAGLGQTVPDIPGVEIFRESTANGVGNEFHQAWQLAERGESDYINIFVPWFWEPGYARIVPAGFSMDAEELDYMKRYGLRAEQMAWRRNKLTSELSEDVDLFDQEYPAEPLLAFRKVKGSVYIEAGLVSRAMDPANRVQAEQRGPKIMGVDPAEYGDDQSAIIVRQGRIAQPVVRYSKHGPMELVGKVAMLADRYRPDVINVDATGIGSGVADRLTELNYPVNRIHFGGKPTDDQLYVLKRDEIWGEMKKWLQDWPCELPKDDVLAGDLCGPQYTYDSSRRLKIESKESMRKRGVKSPDSADALALTFATPFAAYGEAKDGNDSYRASRMQRGR